MKMLAARLRHRVEIQNFTTTQDNDSGALTEIWSAVYKNVPAEVNPLSGREFIAAQATNASVTTKIVIRNHDNILPRMRVLFNGAYYAINVVLHDPTFGNHITLMCESGVRYDIAETADLTQTDYGLITEPVDLSLDYGGI